MDALVWLNATFSDNHNCSGDPLRDSCYMSQAEVGQFNTMTQHACNDVHVAIDDRYIC